MRTGPIIVSFSVFGIFKKWQILTFLKWPCCWPLKLCKPHRLKKNGHCEFIWGVWKTIKQFKYQLHVILSALFGISVSVTTIGGPHSQLAAFWPSCLEDWVFLFGWNNSEEAFGLALGESVSEELFIILYSHFHRLMNQENTLRTFLLRSWGLWFMVHFKIDSGR